MRLTSWPLTSTVHRMRRIQWLLPVCLFLIAGNFEVFEHVVEHEHVGTAFFGELLFFGVMGPAAVWWAMGWAAQHQERLEAANDSILQLNEELEHRVDDRTAQLRTRNAELARANQELKALDKLQSDFVSLVSHELRAPLTNINGGIEMFARHRSSLPRPQRDVLDVLGRECRRLTRLVESILDVSLIEAGKLCTEPRPIPLAPFLGRLLEGRLPEDGPHALIVEVPADLPPVWADEGHLADVLLNLLDNAVKYSPSGGEIRVAAQAMEDECLAITVSDQGIGIREPEQRHLFERFYRVDASPDRHVYGHGLGLYFCRRLVEAQSGRIDVESEGEPGLGATFRVTLPAFRDGYDDDSDPAD